MLEQLNTIAAKAAYAAEVVPVGIYAVTIVETTDATMQAKTTSIGTGEDRVETIVAPAIPRVGLKLQINKKQGDVEVGTLVKVNFNVPDDRASNEKNAAFIERLGHLGITTDELHAIADKNGLDPATGLVSALRKRMLDIRGYAQLGDWTSGGVKFQTLRAWFQTREEAVEAWRKQQ